MSIFRPRVTLTDAAGRTWEVYAYRFRLDDRRPPPAPGERRRRRRLARAPLRFLGRLLWEAPRAALRALRSDEWTIEAVSWYPSRTGYTWTTRREFRDHVLAQVEGQLARGDVPRPRHASFHGAAR